MQVQYYVSQPANKLVTNTFATHISKIADCMIIGVGRGKNAKKDAFDDLLRQYDKEL